MSDTAERQRPICVIQSLPLRLSLEPVLPTRTPSYGSCFVYGFKLRLPDGPEIDRSDPLLVAYGARIVSVAIHDDDDEPVQDDAFDPGSLVRLLPESGGSDEAEVGVWDPEVFAAEAVSWTAPPPSSMPRSSAASRRPRWS